MAAPKTLIHRLSDPGAKGYRRSSLYDVSFEQEKISFHRRTLLEALSRAGGVQRLLLEHRLAGERVVVLLPHGTPFVEGFLGCWLAGAVPVPCPLPRGRRQAPRIDAIVADCGAAALLTAEAWRRRLGGRPPTAHGRQPALLTLEEAEAAGGGGALPEPSAPAELALLQYTSGSTTSPRGVRVTHANLLANLEVIRRSYGLRPGERAVSWLPHHHDMGLIGDLLGALYGGVDLALLEPAAFVQQPLRWLAAISGFGAQLSGAPNFAYHLCAERIAPEQVEALDLSTWRLAYCGAEPVRADTLGRFARTFAAAGFDPRALAPSYGLAEATLLVTSAAADGGGARFLAVDRAALEAGRVQPRSEAEPRPVADGLPDEDPAELPLEATAETVPAVDCGRAGVGHRVRVVDFSRRPLGEGRVGEIWVHGPSVADGYWSGGRSDGDRAVGDDAAGDAPERAPDGRLSFEGWLEDGQGPYLRTGDLGFLWRGGLYVTGRLKDLLIVRGRNLAPQDLEEAAWSAHEALVPHRAAAFTVPAGSLEGAASRPRSAAGEPRVVVACEVRREHCRGPGRSLEDGTVAEAVVRAVRRRTVEALDLAPDGVILLPVGALPLTSSGKIQRSRSRELWLAGELETLAVRRLTPAEAAGDGPGAEAGDGAPSEAISGGPPERLESPGEALRWLRGWVAHRTGSRPEDLPADEPLHGFGLDSVAAVELSRDLGARLGRALPATLVWDHPTLEALAALAGPRGADTPPPGATALPDATAQPDITAQPDGAEELDHLDAEELARLLHREVAASRAERAGGDP